MKKLVKKKHLLDAEEIGFDIKIIEKRLMEINCLPETEGIKLRWKNGFGSEVEIVQDS